MATQNSHPMGITGYFLRCTLMLTVALAAAFPRFAPADEILLGTQAEGSFSHFVGRAICRALNRSAGDLNCTIVPPANGIDNLTNLNGGSLDLALLDSRLLYEAVGHTGRFAFMDIPYDNLGLLVPLYRLPVLLVARADAGIEALADLKGRRINTGVPHSEVWEILGLIQQAKHWTKGDFQLIQELPAVQSQDTMAFCQGSIQAMLHIGTHPNAVMQQLMDLCDAVLVDMNDDDIARLVDGHPALSPIRIPPATYPGQEKPVASFGTTMLLVASGSLDDATILTIMEGLAQNQANLNNIHPALEQFSIQPYKDPGIGLALHPGAATYFSAQDN